MGPIRRAVDGIASTARTRLRRGPERLVDAARRRHAEYWRTHGVSVVDEEWDTLVILDACRYDMFAAHSELPGRLESRRSRGSSTDEFLAANFGDRKCHDTVYVTANPMYQIDEWTGVSLEDCFHDVVDVWETDWNDRLGTVLPEAVAEAAVAVHDAYPEKRILVHFLQPHVPFVGRIGCRRFGEDTNDRVRDYALNGRDETTNSVVWDRLSDGAVEAEAVWEAYVENLRLALPAVETVVEAADGRAVVTSDHGNLLDEFATPFPIRRSGHPPGHHTRHLTTVPWLIAQSGDRRAIRSDPPVSDTTVTDAVDERLADLGYGET